MGENYVSKLGTQKKKCNLWLRLDEMLEKNKEFSELKLKMKN